MELIVCLKQVVDLQQIRVKKETREAVTEGLPFVFGDMDKNALEEAVKIKEKAGGRVTALSVGSPKLRDTVKEALAVGADQAFIIVDPQFDNLDAGQKPGFWRKPFRKSANSTLFSWAKAPPTTTQDKQGRDWQSSSTCHW